MNLNIPPQTEKIINHMAIQQGMSIEQFFITSTYERALELAYNLPENPMIALAKSLPKPTSYNQDDMLLSDFLKTLPKAELQRSGLDIQRELRNEWE